MILENSHSKHKNLSTAWVDYKKAFDSVPHSWILKTLELFKISPILINFIKSSMTKWNTDLLLNHKNGIISIDSLKINCGIFQGDSLSPLLFCLALFPLSKLLNDTQYGYNIFESKINHLFYMDDLKLFGKNDNEIDGLLKTVKTFSDDIGMEFGLDKCAKATFHRGRLVQGESLVIDKSTTIKDLEPDAFYKYLGVNEGDGIQHATMKENIRKEYYRRLRSILKTELNSQNRITAINTLAVPVVTYSFGIINWQLNDIKRMDVKTRKLFTINRMHHPKADVDRLYLPRKQGGRGLSQLELSFKISSISLNEYLRINNDWMLKLVLKHESSKKLYSIVKNSIKYSTELNTNNEQLNHNEEPTKRAKYLIKLGKTNGLDALKAKWESKPLHGRYPLRTKDADVDKLTPISGYAALD